MAVQEVAAVEVGKSWQKCEVDERLAKVVEASCRRATAIVGHRSDCMYCKFKIRGSRKAKMVEKWKVGQRKVVGGWRGEAGGTVLYIAM